VCWCASSDAGDAEHAARLLRDTLLVTPHDVPARLLLAKACLARRRRPDATEAAEGVLHAEAALAALAASPCDQHPGVSGEGAESLPHLMRHTADFAC
jgi:hypothetical protein